MTLSESTGVDMPSEAESSRVANVIHLAIAQAIDALPPRALGIRSHAISTEDFARECASAIAQISEERRSINIHAVIGHSNPPKSTASNIEILPRDAAAARATQLRSDSAALPDGH